MKTETEIRSHLADLVACSEGPCRHRHSTDRERAQCLEGKLLLKVVVDALYWVLGEPGDYDRVAQRCAKEAGR